MTSEFDAVASEYDAQLDRGLSLTGDSAAYYARGRLRLLRQCLERLGFRAEAVIDFGCGTGRSIPLFQEILGARRILGVDDSAASLARAAAEHGGPLVEFATPRDARPARYDLAFANGVFHHIPRRDRPPAVAWIHDHLRPGGLLALWENNPWNPGTRLVMRRIPFDRNAILLSPRTASRMLRQGEFQVLRTDFAFFFPAFLKPLRPLEPLLRQLPLGGQFQVLATVGSC